MGEVRDRSSETERHRSDSPRAGASDRGNIGAGDSRKARDDYERTPKERHSDGHHREPDKAPKDGHNHKSFDVKDDHGNKIGRQDVERWTDNKGEHIQQSTKDLAGNEISKIDSDITRNRDGSIHVHDKGMSPDGTIFVNNGDYDKNHNEIRYDTHTYRTDQGGQLHEEISKRDAKGTTNTTKESWHDENGDHTYSNTNTVSADSKEITNTITETTKDGKHERTETHTTKTDSNSVTKTDTVTDKTAK